MISDFVTRLPIVLCNNESDCHSIGQCDCACDCACVQESPIVPVGLLPVMLEDSAFLQRVAGLYESPLDSVGLDDRYHLALNTFSNTGVVVLNDTARQILDRFQYPFTVEQARSTFESLTPAAVNHAIGDMFRLNLLRPTCDEPRTAMGKPSVLSAWLHITDRCNLRCTYCYLPHAPADMSLEIGQAVVEAAFRSALAHGYPAVKLKYAGGEPLLRFGTVVSLHRYAQTLAQRHNLSLNGVVLSNGTLLTARIVDQMRSLGLRLMISLDGLGRFHDLQRAYADGRGSAQDVTRSVDLALSYGLTPDISITVSSRNIEGLPQLLDWVLDRDLPFSLNFYRENDLSSSQADLQLKDSHIIAGMRAAYEVVEANLPHRNLLGALVDRANLAAPHPRTCDVGQSYLVFDCHGRVYKCQMDVNHPITDVHDPDPLARVRGSGEGIQNLRVDEKAGCHDCQWRYLCAGGCPLQTYHVTGRYDIKSPYCNIYRTLYPEVIRLEGLRLLRQANVGEQRRH